MTEYSQTLRKAAERLVEDASNTAVLSPVKRVEPATRIMLGLASVVLELVKSNAELAAKVEKLEPYADE